MMTVIGPLLTLAVVLLVRMRRRQSEKPLSGRFLWLPPLVYLTAVIAMLVRQPPTPSGWLLLMAGVGLGAAVGWFRGRLFALRIDPASGAVLRRRSRAAVLLLVGIVAVRFLANLWIDPAAEPPSGSEHALLASDSMLGCVFGLLAVTRVEIAIRARRLRAAHRIEHGHASA